MPRTGGLELGAPSLQGETGLRGLPWRCPGSQGSGKGCLLGWMPTGLSGEGLLLHRASWAEPHSLSRAFCPSSFSRASCSLAGLMPLLCLAQVTQQVTVPITLPLISSPSFLAHCGCFASIPAFLGLVPGAEGQWGRRGPVRVGGRFHSRQCAGSFVLTWFSGRA